MSPRGRDPVRRHRGRGPLTSAPDGAWGGRYGCGIDILLLCTGNICRSPMAEVLLRDRLARVGIDAHVHSAGLLDDGRPASAPGVTVLGERGLDLTAHRSRRMTAELLQDADLVIAMAREHVREAVVLEPDVFPRAFTLRELVRRAVDRPRQPTEELRDWARRLHTGRTRRDLLGASPEDDVADPIGGPPKLYAATAEELDELLGRFVELGWGGGAG